MPPALDDLAVTALVGLATAARERAHAPYSGFAVGAAVVADDDRVFAACNVENASYGLSLCAERAALAGAVARGVRAVRAVVVVAGGGEPPRPCGACLQWIAELGGPGTEIVSVSIGGARERASLRDLLPRPYRLGSEAAGDR